MFDATESLCARFNVSHYVLCRTSVRKGRVDEMNCNVSVINCDHSSLLCLNTYHLGLF